MSADRAERLLGLLPESQVDAMLVTDLVNVRYLTGFTGTNGVCVCGAETRLFFTDFRYTERAEAEVEGWEVITIEDDWLGGIAARLSGRPGDLCTVLDLICLRPGSESARSVRRGSDRHQHRRGVVPHPQHPLRPHPSGRVQPARPCNSLTDDEEPRR